MNIQLYCVTAHTNNRQIISDGLTKAGVEWIKTEMAFQGIKIDEIKPYAVNLPAPKPHDAIALYDA